MSQHNQNAISRRQMVGWMSVPLLAAAGCSVIGQTAAAPFPSEPAAGTKVFNIRDFGAIGDGKTLNTRAVQATIDAAAADGGGTVLVPAGVFLIGTVELKSYITLHLVAGATLLGSVHGKDYHAASAIPLEGDVTLSDGNWALIYATYAENVSIEGPGTIDGQGAAFHPAVRGETPPAGVKGDQRPYHCLFYRCKDLAVRNITLLNSGYHSIRVIESTFVRMDSIHIFNRVSGNNDGFHFISAQYVTVSNCNVQSQDDACALFGSCQFINITNSTFSTRWSVFRFGGGIARNVAVSNCVLAQVYGCPIKMSASHGTVFENMSFSNLVLDDVTGPINIAAGTRQRRRNRGGSSTRPEADTRPDEYELAMMRRGPAVIRGISFSNIYGTVTTNPGQLAGLPFALAYNPGEKFSCITINGTGDAVIENISFSDIHLTFGGGGTAEMGANRKVPKILGEYFDLGPMPAYGFYARGARGITLSNIRFQVSQDELRPAMILDGVTDAAIVNFNAQGNARAESLVRFMNSGQVLFTAPRVLSKVPVFLRAEGSACDRIIIDGGDLSNAQTAVQLADGAADAAVKVRA